VLHARLQNGIFDAQVTSVANIGDCMCELAVGGAAGEGGEAGSSLAAAAAGGSGDGEGDGELWLR
jgi:hypothetical protein